MTSLPEIDIVFTNDFDEACSLRDEGYEPIECAFGQYGSVLGEFNLDHHGTESHREGVAIRACRDLYGARVGDPRFVVTGTPDADAILAIIALSGIVDDSRITRDFYELVNAHDTDPIGIDLLQNGVGIRLAWFNQVPGLRQSARGFRKGIKSMCRLLNIGLTTEEMDHTQRADRARRRRAQEGMLARFDASGNRLPIPDTLDERPVLRGEAALDEAARILVVNSSVWGFDMWYRSAPTVVSFASRIEKVTVGCPDRETAELLFGSGGLQNVWPHLGRGWGGRETIGGSPRGEPLELEHAHQTAEALSKLLV